MSHIHEALKKATSQRDKKVLIDTLYLSIREVQARRGKSIKESKADDLTSAAKEVIAELSAAEENDS